MDLTFLAVEVERALPRICPCENGGTCKETEDGGVECVCRAPLQLPYCATAAAATAARAATTAAVVVPILLILVVALGGAAAWFVIRKRPL